MKDPIEPTDPDVMRSTEVAERPGYYHDDTGREFTTRGFQVYARITDTHGVQLRVQESSAADHACVWLFTEQAEDVHLDLEQARALHEALGTFLSIHG